MTRPLVQLSGQPVARPIATGTFMAGLVDRGSGEFTAVRWWLCRAGVTVSPGIAPLGAGQPDSTSRDGIQSRAVLRRLNPAARRRRTRRPVGFRMAVHWHKLPMEVISWRRGMWS